VAVCKAGTGGSTCSICVAGYYSTGGPLTNPTAACIQCPSKKTLNNATGSTASTACAPVSG